ncbi:MAG TPA: FtsK/SpoIIIE domain-containing protein [Acidimicrobiales bacterium]|nr:FtsK/SpoIIIE domain-containing protein [Acidimicrobiales bacterium]
MTTQPRKTPVTSVEKTGWKAGLELIRDWWVNAVVIGPPSALTALVYFRFGRALAIIVGVLLVAAGVGVPVLRRLIVRSWHVAGVRRTLYRAITHERGILRERPPRIKKVRPTEHGDAVILKLGPGTSVNDVTLASDSLVSTLKALGLRVAADSNNKNLVTLTVIRRDPFGSGTIPCPLLNVDRFDIREPIPLGPNEEGVMTLLSLIEQNVLGGGAPGSGKSAALSIPVAACALDRNVDLWLFDGKLVELAAWSICARRFVGPDLELAIEVLEELRDEMDSQYQQILARGLRKVPRDGTMRFHVVVIDELALYVAGVDKKLAGQFAELLRDLVSRGRAAGVIVLAATQKPSADVIPSALRDLFAIRLAFRCTTREASDTVLGSGWASQGFSAADIDAGNHGVGLLLDEGGTPIRMKTFYLSDDDIRTIAERGRRLRDAAEFEAEDNPW